MIYAKKYSYTHVSELRLQKDNKIYMELLNVVKQLNINSPRILSLVYPNFSYKISSNVILSDPFLYCRFFNENFINVNFLIDDIINKKFDLIIIGSHNKLNLIPAKCPVDYLINSIKVVYKLNHHGYFDYYTI